MYNNNNNNNVYHINHRARGVGGGGCNRETKNCNVHARGKVIRLRCIERAALRLVVAVVVVTACGRDGKRKSTCRNSTGGVLVDGSLTD